jgi:NitT/TauT family transport system permease protein
MSVREELFGPNPLWFDLFSTTRRAVFAFFLAVGVGVPIGLLMGQYVGLRRALQFLVDFFRSIPPIALFPLFILSFGLGEISRIAVPFYGAVLIMIVSSMYGVLNAPSLRRQVGVVHGLSRVEVFWKIVFPDAIPHIVSGMRNAVSLCLVLVVVVEMFWGAPSGLGKRLFDAHLAFQSPRLYAVIFFIGILGYTLNLVLQLIEVRFLSWREK